MRITSGEEDGGVMEIGLCLVSDCAAPPVFLLIVIKLHPKTRIINGMCIPSPTLRPLP